MLLSSTIYYIIETQYLKAGFSMFVLAALAAIGMIHSFQVEDTGVIESAFVWDCGCVDARQEVITYCMFGSGLVLFHFWNRLNFRKEPPPPPLDEDSKAYYLQPSSPAFSLEEKPTSFFHNPDFD